MKRRVVSLSCTNQQPRQGLPKGQPGPVKAKVHSTRTEQIVLAFFNNKGMPYTNYVLRGTMMNARYIMEALGKFMKIFRKKRPVMTARDWMFHWDNAPVHNSTMSDWIATRQIKLIEHPPCSQDLTPVDFLLFTIVKRKLASLTIA
jgi:hypothetical protein